MRFEQPWWFLLLLLVLPVMVAGVVHVRAMAAGRRVLALVIRTVLLIVLVGLLARPHSVQTARTLATVMVVDSSESVRRWFAGGGQAGVTKIRDFVAKASILGEELGGGRGAEDLVGVVVFDGRAWVAALPGRRDISELPLEVVPSEGTNLADAVRLAWSLVPSTATGRVVLLTDGNQTRGDVLGVLGAGPVDVVPLEYRVENEVEIERLDAPATAPGGAIVPLRVVLRSTGPARGYIRLMAGDVVVGLAGGVGPGGARVPVELKAGQNIVRLEVPLDERRVHRFRAVFEPETVEAVSGAQSQGARAVGDTVEENNTAEAFVISPSSGAVLVVNGAAAGGGGEGSGESMLAATLEGAGLAVKVVAPEGLPADLLGLEEYDCVVLDNVPADALAPGAAAALAGYVQDLGGGLVMVGGQMSFGAGGWRGSALEPVLPVLLELPERLLASEVAIVFVLDNSGSMWRPVMGSSRTQQEIANDAAAGAIQSLDRLDQVGVITFNSEADELVPLAQNLRPAESTDRVRGIMSGGGTNAGPGLAMAGAWLRGATAKSKHVLVLSDGRSINSQSLPDQAGQLARDGIKVSTISVGDDADTSTMAEMARRGGGASFIVTNPRTLPQIFMKAVRIVRTPLVREEPFVPVLLATGSALTSGLASVPALGGLSLTQARSEPTVVNAMMTPKGEPVLAHWQVGLGKCAAFTSDSSLWAAGWIATPVYGQFWKQVVRGVARTSTATQGMSVSVNAVDGEGNGGIRVRLVAAGLGAGKEIKANVSLYTPGEEEGSVVEAALSAVAPGVYEALLTPREGGSGVGSYVAVVKPLVRGTGDAGDVGDAGDKEGWKSLPPLVAGTSVNGGQEVRFLTSNIGLLRQIATASGGRVLDINRPEAARLFDRTGVPERQRLLPLWPLLLWAALWLTLLDIANRRLAWDRWVSELFGGARATQEAPLGAAQRVATLLAGAENREDAQRDERPAIALGEVEAQLLREQAKDRRIADRLAQLAAAGRAQGSLSSPVNVNESEGERQPGVAANEEGGLLAAKRRAAERFKEEG